MAEAGTIVVFGAAYDDYDDAVKDYEAMQERNVDGALGDYEAALLTREPNGAVVVSNVDASGVFKTSIKGAAIGAVLGVLFPASAIRLALLGAAAGAAKGQVERYLTRGDMQGIGELLEPGRTGILYFAETLSDDAAKWLFPKALRKVSVEVEADAEAIKTALRDAAG